MQKNIIGLKVKIIKKRKEEKNGGRKKKTGGGQGRKTPQNCKTSKQRQKFIMTIKKCD